MEVVRVKRVLVLAVLLVSLTSLLGAAQCGCFSQPVGDEPVCYTGYWEGVDVGFKLVVPGEYFCQSPVPETPLLTGWHVEALDGTIIYEEQFIVPKGHHHEMVWDQTDGQCNQVPPGIYRLVIQTTTAGEIYNYVKIQPWPGPFNCCTCCCTRIDSCPCWISHSPYIEIAPCTGRPYVWGSINIKIHFELDSCCGSCCP
jgi:hypothetical protein